MSFLKIKSRWRKSAETRIEVSSATQKWIHSVTGLNKWYIPMAWDSDYDWKDRKIKLMMFWFTSCPILITNLESKRSWDSTFLLVSTVHVLVKCKLSFCFSTSAEEYEAKMPQYFLYEQQVVHQSSMIPMYYMWAPITVHHLCNM